MSKLPFDIDQAEIHEYVWNVAHDLAAIIVVMILFKFFLYKKKKKRESTQLESFAVEVVDDDRS